jgi:hypothetical protein
MENLEEKQVEVCRGELLSPTITEDMRCVHRGKAETMN